MSQGCKALVGFVASAHKGAAHRAGSCEDFARRAKSEGPFSARRQVGRTEESGQSRGRQNLEVQAPRSRLPGRWRSTGARENCQRRPGKPAALQAGCSCRNNRSGLRTEWEQAPAAAGSKAWSACAGGNSPMRLPGLQIEPRSGPRAGASAPSGHDTSNHGRKRATSPSRCRPTGR